jgi:glucose/arabinose dehydrogenase
MTMSGTPWNPQGDGTRSAVKVALVAGTLAVVAAGALVWKVLNIKPLEATVTPEGMRDAALAKAKVPTPPSADGITMAEGFVAERVVSVPKEMGSIASMCVLPDGSLVLGPQNGRLLHLHPETGAIEPIPAEIGDAQGLVYVKDALYVVVNGSAAQGQGLYRVTDSNADGSLDAVQLLRLLPGDTGEHGAHGIALGPDGLLYITIGNHATLPKPEGSLVPQRWQEDFLLPRMWDANGHAVGIMAPGGFIVRTNLDGSRWELFSDGYRNAYDLAFSPDGELFTYDSDMEWDIGAPWYRPTAVCHVTSGSDFGWRSGSACPPTWYVDLVPPVLPVGPGSPTGVVFGTGSNFPPPWRDALFCLDWTYATIHAVFLEPQGASYSAKREQFLAGKGLPLTDAVINPKDGAMYLSTGGRGAASSIYRIRAVEPSSVPARDPTTTPERVLRQELEKAQIATATDAQIEAALVALSSDDRLNRFTARSVLEHQSLDRWSGRPIPAPTTQGIIEHSLALVRCGAAPERDRAIATLLALDWNRISPVERRDALRTILVGLARHGMPEFSVTEALRRHLDFRFPVDGSAGRSSARRDPRLPRFAVGHCQGPSIDGVDRHHG